MNEAIFAAGCFWGVEAAFKLKAGVLKTKVGYIGGKRKQPSYEQVCSGATGHAEAIWLEFDPQVVSYEELLDYLFNIHNPTSLNKQGNDVGSQYRSAIFYLDENQKELAAEYIKDVSGNYDKPIVTTLEKAGEFWDAEEYHQDYLTKNPGGYCHINLSNLPR